ncbi:hypothetical protein BDV96DRAFT_633785 [Lophiotrema nucula]|uniref:Uncharacterized protein n=1 Tax=Lophiotrema nucula TaxID=690887 RepID=A0A6A5Z264_9PLEO|nr:hypothetical protein BDV96DRAFT_633785 [Lophiotrema nucula]
MVASHFVCVGLAAITCVAASFNEEHVFAALLKRQEPGTPSYNCHDNCGTAITISKAGGDVCNNNVFLADYKECLQCAGPDNYNIWKYYGNSLTPVASGCGLSTMPLSGKQEDPAEALHHSSSSSIAQSTATSSSERLASSLNVPASTTSAPELPTSAPTYLDPVVSTANEVVPSSIYTVPTHSSNGTVTSTSPPPQQTVNAAGVVAFNAGLFGAVVLAAGYGLGS